MSEEVNYRCDRCGDDCTDTHLNVTVQTWGWPTARRPHIGTEYGHLCTDCAAEFLAAYKAWLRSKPKDTVAVLGVANGGNV